jgi:methyltransferase NSUN6
MDQNCQHIAAKYNFSFDVIELLWQKYGARTEEIVKALKRPCKKYAIRVNTLKISAKEVQASFQRMGVAAELHPILDEVLFLPVQGPSSIPVYNKRIVVDKFTAESLLQGADLFAPGVEKVGKIRVGNHVSIADRRGDIIASGIAEMTSNDMLQLRRGLAVRITDSAYKVFSIRNSDLFKEGVLYDQSFPSMLVSRVLDPKPNEFILDMCAAPGGKATHLAQLMRNQGKIVAVDRSMPRLKQLENHMRRLGLTNIEVICADSRKLSEDYYQRIDKILIDPPCSALGVRPKLWDNTTKKEIADLVKYQHQFLDVSIKYIKQNGIIVYCTCTLTTEENEGNVKYLCENYGFKIIAQPFILGSPGEKLEGLENWQHLQRFYPDTHGTPGYFIAKLQMRS